MLQFCACALERAHKRVQAQSTRTHKLLHRQMHLHGQTDTRTSPMIKQTGAAGAEGAATAAITTTATILTTVSATTAPAAAATTSTTTKISTNFLTDLYI